MNKPTLLMVYDYEMAPHQVRVPHSSSYLLEQELKNFFIVKRKGEIPNENADIVFNTLPLRTHGGLGNDLFTDGKVTAFWSTSPLEGLGEGYFPRCNIIFSTIPSWIHKFPPEKTTILLDAVDPSYKEYPQEKIFDVGFLGSEIEATRVNLLNKIQKNFSMLRGSMQLGEESARALSQCELVLSVQDWYWHNAGTERRLFTFGNIRPIMVRYNKDYESVGRPNEHYIPYGSDEECLQKIEYFLGHMDEAEKIGNRLKEVLKTHTFYDRAKTIYETYKKYTII